MRLLQRRQRALGSAAPAALKAAADKISRRDQPNVVLGILSLLDHVSRRDIFIEARGAVGMVARFKLVGNTTESYGGQGARIPRLRLLWFEVQTIWSCRCGLEGFDDFAPRMSCAVEQGALIERAGCSPAERTQGARRTKLPCAPKTTMVDITNECLHRAADWIFFGCWQCKRIQQTLDDRGNAVITNPMDARFGTGKIHRAARCRAFTASIALFAAAAAVAQTAPSVIAVSNPSR